MILSKYMLNYVLIAPFLQMLDDLKKENKILRKKTKEQINRVNATCGWIGSNSNKFKETKWYLGNAEIQESYSK